MNPKCRVCNENITDEIFLTKDMFMSKKGEFLYYRCQNCGCVQISDFPQNLPEFYPNEYCDSFGLAGAKVGSILKNIITKTSFYRYPVIYNFLNYYEILDERVKTIRTLRLQQNVTILDVGAGDGYFLNALMNLGFNNVYGLEPYGQESIKPKIVKGTIRDLEKGQTFDVITYNDSFEHIWDPKSELIEMYKHLNFGGIGIIRLPIAASGFRQYRQYWFELDPPRHFYLHTLKSMEILFEKSKFKILSIDYDSFGRSYMFSEMYKKGKPFVQQPLFLQLAIEFLVPNSYLLRRRAKSENNRKEGNHAIIIFKKL